MLGGLPDEIEITLVAESLEPVPSVHGQRIPPGPKVDWVGKARWVEDGKFFTSPGVSAGMDMALAVIAHLYGKEVARNMAVGTEYEWHEEASWDPFSSLAGLD